MLPGPSVPGGIEMSVNVGRFPAAGDERPAPTFSVVVPTFNRSQLVARAIRSVLDQTFTDFELIVVDDGSTDDTPKVLAAIQDPRVHLVHQENQRLSAARNAGAAVAAAAWLTFLDDDDEALPGWLELFRGEIGDPRCGVVCCGGVIVDEDGRPVGTMRPRQLGAAYDNLVGSFVAGTFAVRRDLFYGVGGYAPGLPTSHGTELAFRLFPHCVSQGWAIRSVPEAGVRFQERPAVQRAQGAPDVLLKGVTFVLERHRERLRRAPRTFANFMSIAGVCAARLGRYREARRFLAQAVRAEPLVPKRWARLLLTLVPPLGDRVWRLPDPGRAPDELV
jgi:glycosyltransferase involved in cell wall biosynthesis